MSDGLTANEGRFRSVRYNCIVENIVGHCKYTVDTLTPSDALCIGLYDIIELLF